MHLIKMYEPGVPSGACAKLCTYCGCVLHDIQHFHVVSIDCTVRSQARSATPTVHCNAYVKAIVHIRYGISFVSSLPGLCLVVTMFGLFSPKAEKLRLHSRIEDLLDVPVIEKDGFSEHICKNCKRKLEHLEKAVEELTDFQHQAKTILQREHLKCTKGTSSFDGVSPDTAKTRPPYK